MADFFEDQNVQNQTADFSFSPILTPEDFVEPAQPVEPVVPVEPVEPVKTIERKKSAKDFTPEEKAAILARAERIEFSRVAKEFNTTWQAVSAIRKEAQKAATRKADTKAVKPEPAKKETPKPESAKTPVDEKKKSKDFTSEEKQKILERAAEIGVSGAAREFGTSRWVVTQWTRNALKKDPSAFPAKHKRGRFSPKPLENNKPEESKNVQKVEALNTNPTISEEELEIENAILREKVAALTEQLEKLRAAVAKLA